MNRIFHGFCDCLAVQSSPGGNCGRLFIFAFRTSSLSSPAIVLLSHLEKISSLRSCCFLLPSVHRSWGRSGPFICPLAQSHGLNILIIHFLPGFWRLREYFGGPIHSSCSLISAIVSLHSLLSSLGLLAGICFCYFQSRNLSLQGGTPWF